MSKSTTKVAIAHAFKELLHEKSFDKITISDITDKCDINRQTFYYHFSDIIDLTEWICAVDTDKALKENKTATTWQEGFLSIFDIVRNDKNFIMNLYRHVPREYLYNYLYRMTYDLIYAAVDEVSGDLHVREEDKEFIANFYKYGFVGLMIDWIEHDMQEDPKDIVKRLDMLISGTSEKMFQSRH
ncbi:TetR/AcrR family transcriptional regulator [Butyrivibrio sp. MC2013]|uniref:TetR/AcrR family transcriptional regulator n=1 Tax=Butyrivibrio sp. MC2013 TaxID=1280686 RepID=UPI0003FF411F|nr:TetR/AcrR family transcriptional regulator [Butyrivibrio sp. MC2013]